MGVSMGALPSLKTRQAMGSAMPQLVLSNSLEASIEVLIAQPAQKASPSCLSDGPSRKGDRGVLEALEAMELALATAVVPVRKDNGSSGGRDRIGLKRTRCTHI